MVEKKEMVRLRNGSREERVIVDYTMSAFQRLRTLYPGSARELVMLARDPKYHLTESSRILLRRYGLLRSGQMRHCVRNIIRCASAQVRLSDPQWEPCDPRKTAKE